MAGLRGAVAALVLLLAAVPAAAEAKRPKLRCSAGLTLYAEGRLRVFGVPFHGGGEWGSDEYACLGARRRPLPVGVVSSNGGTGSLDTLAFAFGGGRYLGSYHTSDGEGGGEGWFAVVDLETRRTVVEADAGWHDTAPPFRVAANGALITEDEDIEVRAPGSRHAKTLSTPGVTATDLAVAGATVYWTEHPDDAAPAVRSAILPGVPGGPEARMLEPRYPRETGGACRAARGRTIAASPRVRVYERTTPSGAIRRLACRRGGDRAVRIDAGVPAPRIAGDRWLLSLGAGRPATVVDMHAGDVVTSVDASVATLLGDGALAWFGSDGRGLAQRPAGDAPVELAAADPAPSALASSRHTVYWTSGGAPRGARPPRG